ncbi:LCP family protein [Patescibacteria group bacterium]
MKGKILKRKIKRVKFPKTKGVIGLIIFICVSFLIYKSGLKISDFLHSTGLSPKTVLRLIFDSGSELRDTQGFTNVVILGVGGGVHAGSDLTDTMLLVSVNSQNKSLNYISIPRDIWSETLKDKVNTAYHYGEKKEIGGGLMLSKIITEEIVKKQIHYAVMVDFLGFVKIIDLIGGLEIDVQTGFVDEHFPITGKEDDDCDGDSQYLCRYMEVEFKKGIQHMDGERALIYVRSRYAEGDQGTDFARGKRQQEVLNALKNKLFKFSELMNFQRNKILFDTVTSSINTDMNLVEMLTFIKIFTRINDSETNSINIDELFYVSDDPYFEGRYVLVPIDDFEVVGKYIEKKLNGE